VHVATWNFFHRLIDNLIETAKFSKSGIIHRIYYFKDNYPVDIVPFNGISGEKGIITWPDHQQMSTKGFNEAFKDCYEVRIAKNPDKVIPVASPVGLVLMKLISWEESARRSEKDAQDLELIFSNYHYLFQNTEKIYENPKILEQAGYDIQRAGTILLGMDTAAIINENETKKTICSIIEKETNTDGYSGLAINMMRKNSSDDKEYERKIQLIQDFKTGFCLR
jgi:predicted nucleotidyltransferase